MVDLHDQHKKIQTELSAAISEVIDSSSFINGPAVQTFSEALASFSGARHVVPCANGTDALQIVLMALDLPAGAEVILPSFNYVAAAEVVAFLGLRPVFADVDINTFNIKVEDIEKKITENTKAIVPVHLFGQCAEMKKILDLATRYKLFVIEDAAQSMGAAYTFPDGKIKYAGTMGVAGITSFFPTKNLGSMGDGGGIFTNDDILAEKMKMIANHGQKERYKFEIIGMNSRLDAIQAAVLNVKLKSLDSYIEKRRWVAKIYSEYLENCPEIILPYTKPENYHSWNQYTIQIANGSRDILKEYLKEKNIPSMIYYPLPLHQQPAYNKFKTEPLPVSEKLCKIVLSLPIHTELDEEQVFFIASEVRKGVKEVVKSRF